VSDTKKQEWDVEHMTDEHKKLFYLISKYAHPAKTMDDDEVWLKELPLRIFSYDGITEGVFEAYDYAPLSIEIIGGRRFLNISQEMEDDIADLREMNLIDCLKLSSVTYMIVNAYRTKRGVIVDIPEKFKKQIDTICECPKCKCLLETRLNENPNDSEEVFELFCPKPDCDYSRYSGITAIEDVSYKTEAYIPNIKTYDLLRHSKEEFF
jgi:hypothetical protein